MDERAIRLLALSKAPGFGNRRVANLIRINSVDEVYEAPRRFESLIGEPAVHAIECGSAREGAERMLDSARRASQTVISLGTPGYPTSLAEIYDPPPVLFLRGTLAPASRRVAIVGSRGATNAGRTFARDTAAGLAARGIEVVSGLARGIDGASHEGALAGGGVTVAVLGSSVDIVYPAEHEALARRIVGSGGAVLSELPPGTRPAPGQFPLRNRIIVGLCEAVLVVEAGEKSGALITARVALDEGRDVMAVPARPSDPLGWGTNRLIRDGAPLVQCLEDVLRNLGLAPAEPAHQAPAGGEEVLAKLAHSAAKSLDQLVRDTGLEASTLMVKLAELELEGKVERLPGTLFRGATPA